MNSAAFYLVELGEGEAQQVIKFKGLYQSKLVVKLPDHYYAGVSGKNILKLYFKKTLTAMLSPFSNLISQ